MEKDTNTRCNIWAHQAKQPNSQRLITYAQLILTLLFLSVMAFTISCSSGDGDGNNSSSSSEYIIDNVEKVKIGEQTWMKRNLNVEPTGANNAATNSWCYDNAPANCEKYGRLYDWATIMALPEECNNETCENQIDTPHQGLCPKGYHVPTVEEWDILVNYVGGSSKAGTKLKAKEGWNSSDIPTGTDDYGFSALPGGSYNDATGYFNSIGNIGSWWSSVGQYGNITFSAIFRDIYYDSENIDWNGAVKISAFSVRCIKD